jgi:hypothetical protein
VEQVRRHLLTLDDEDIVVGTKVGDEGVP